MLDSDVIIRKIDSIQNCLQRIVEKTQNHPKWIDDMDVKDIVVLNLIRAIQLCIDIAGGIITQQKWGIPKTMAESFIILERNKMIDEKLCKKMCKMVGFRNVATHAYKEINYEIVNNIVSHHLNNFENFYSEILKYFDHVS